jgi:hypothetical protein
LQESITEKSLHDVTFINSNDGWAVGYQGTILHTTNGGGSWVEKEKAEKSDLRPVIRLKIIPNPFVSFATLPGHSSDRFALYDVSGRRVGTYRGDRIGEGLVPGVYFIRELEAKAKPVRVVKVR